MKKFLFILLTFFSAIAADAQTRGDVYTGKGPVLTSGVPFVQYPYTGGKPVKGYTTVTGIILAPGTSGPNLQADTNSADSLYTFDLKKEDGTIVSVGTKDYGFAVPKGIAGRTVTIEGLEYSLLPRKRNTMKNGYQQGIQIAATGIQVIE